ncbi:MAG: GIDE domain-containing protein [Gammaproteobacteria bacterium]
MIEEIIELIFDAPSKNSRITKSTFISQQQIKKHFLSSLNYWFFFGIIFTVGFIGFFHFILNPETSYTPSKNSNIEFNQIYLNLNEAENTVSYNILKNVSEKNQSKTITLQDKIYLSSIIPPGQYDYFQSHGLLYFFPEIIKITNKRNHTYDIGFYFYKESNLRFFDNIAIFFTLILAGLGFYLSFKFLSIAKSMQNTPTSNIRTAAQGYTEIKAIQKNIPNFELKSRISKNTCTFYRFTVYEKIEGSDQKSNWFLIDSGDSQAYCIYATDETGSCYIETKKAFIKNKHRFSWYGDYIPLSNVDLKKISFFNRLFGRFFYGYHFIEELMFPETPIYAIGEFKTIPMETDKTILKHVLSAPPEASGKTLFISDFSEAKLIFKNKFYSFLYFIIFLCLLGVLPLHQKYIEYHDQKVKANIAVYKHS